MSYHFFVWIFLFSWIHLLSACLHEPIKYIDKPAGILYRGLSCDIVFLLLSLDSHNFDTVFDEAIGHDSLARARLIVYNDRTGSYEDRGTVKKGLVSFEFRDLIESGDYFFFEQYRFYRNKWLPAFVINAPSLSDIEKNILHTILLEKITKLSPVYTVSLENSCYLLKELLGYFFSGHLPDADFIHTFYFFYFKKDADFCSEKKVIHMLTARSFSREHVEQIELGNFLVTSFYLPDSQPACFIVIGSSADCVHCYAQTIKTSCFSYL